MTLVHALISGFFVFAGAFALASIFHDLRAGWVRYQQIKKELTDDDA